MYESVIDGNYKSGKTEIVLCLDKDKCDWKCRNYFVCLAREYSTFRKESEPKSCHICNGRGTVAKTMVCGFVTTQYRVTCYKCRGKGVL